MVSDMSIVTKIQKPEQKSCIQSKLADEITIIANCFQFVFCEDDNRFFVSFFRWTRSLIDWISEWNEVWLSDKIIVHFIQLWTTQSHNPRMKVQQTTENTEMENYCHLTRPGVASRNLKRIYDMIWCCWLFLQVSLVSGGSTRDTSWQLMATNWRRWFHTNYILLSHLLSQICNNIVM